MPSKLLSLLQETLDREIPICRAIGVRVCADDEQGLALSMPLDANRNHQATAFAGSLNALCTLAGWGRAFCILRKNGHGSGIVIRRSQVRYLRPVTSATVLAICPHVAEEEQAFFLEMLGEKGKAKLDLAVSVAATDGPAVTFHGSYVAVRSD